MLLVSNPIGLLLLTQHNTYSFCTHANVYLRLSAEASSNRSFPRLSLFCFCVLCSLRTLEFPCILGCCIPLHRSEHLSLVSEKSQWRSDRLQYIYIYVVSREAVFQATFSRFWTKQLIYLPCATESKLCSLLGACAVFS